MPFGPHVPATFEQLPHLVGELRPRHLEADLARLGDVEAQLVKVGDVGGFEIAVAHYQATVGAVDQVRRRPAAEFLFSVHFDAVVVEADLAAQLRQAVLLGGQADEADPGPWLERHFVELPLARHFERRQYRHAPEVLEHGVDFGFGHVDLVVAAQQADPGEVVAHCQRRNRVLEHHDAFVQQDERVGEFAFLAIAQEVAGDAGAQLVALQPFDFELEAPDITVPGERVHLFGVAVDAGNPTETTGGAEARQQGVAHEGRNGAARGFGTLHRQHAAGAQLARTDGEQQGQQLVVLRIGEFRDLTFGEDEWPLRAGVPPAHLLEEVEHQMVAVEAFEHVEAVVGQPARLTTVAQVGVFGLGEGPPQVVELLPPGRLARALWPTGAAGRARHRQDLVRGEMAGRRQQDVQLTVAGDLLRVAALIGSQKGGPDVFAQKARLVPRALAGGAQDAGGLGIEPIQLDLVDTAAAANGGVEAVVVAGVDGDAPLDEILLAAFTVARLDFMGASFLERHREFLFDARCPKAATRGGGQSPSFSWTRSGLQETKAPFSLWGGRIARAGWRGRPGRFRRRAADPATRRARRDLHPAAVLRR